MPRRTLRTIVDEPTFVRQRSLVSPDIERFDEAMEGVIWALAREPEQFPIADEQRQIRVAKTIGSFHGLPPFRVFFIIRDDTKVHLLWVEATLLETEGGAVTK